MKFEVFWQISFFFFLQQNFIFYSKKVKISHFISKCDLFLFKSTKILILVQISFFILNLKCHNFSWIWDFSAKACFYIKIRHDLWNSPFPNKIDLFLLKKKHLFCPILIFLTKEPEQLISESQTGFSFSPAGRKCRRGAFTDLSGVLHEEAVDQHGAGERLHGGFHLPLLPSECFQGPTFIFLTLPSSF